MEDGGWRSDFSFQPPTTSQRLFDIIRGEDEPGSAKSDE